MSQELKNWEQNEEYPWETAEGVPMVSKRRCKSETFRNSHIIILLGYTKSERTQGCGTLQKSLTEGRAIGSLQNSTQLSRPRWSNIEGTAFNGSFNSSYPAKLARSNGEPIMIRYLTMGSDDINI